MPQACAGQDDGLAACRKCTERGLKGGRLLGLLRKVYIYIYIYIYMYECTPI